MFVSIRDQYIPVFTCVALAKAGLLVGPLRLSVRPQLLGYLVCVICNPKSFQSFLFKLCIMIAHILKICTFYLVHISHFFLIFLRVFELIHFFYPKCIGGA